MNLKHTLTLHFYDTICHAKRKIQNEKSHPVCQVVFGSSLSSSEENIEMLKCVSAAIRQTDKTPDLMSLHFAVLEPPMLQLRDFGWFDLTRFKVDGPLAGGSA